MFKPRCLPTLFLIENLEFGQEIFALLNETTLTWSMINNLMDLEQFEPSEWVRIVMDGNATEKLQRAIKLRESGHWNRIPVVVFGGNYEKGDLPEDDKLLLLPMPRSGEELETYLALTHDCLKVGGKTGRERRRSVRFKLKRSCTISMDAKILDISEGGAQIESSVRVERGSILDLNASCVGGLRDLIKFKVIDVRPHQKKENVFVYHGKFIEIDGALKKQLNRALWKLQVSGIRQSGPIAVPANLRS